MDDEEPLSGDVDTVAPWTIKSVSGRTRAGMTRMAKQRDCSIGVLLDQLFAEAEGRGMPALSSSGRLAQPVTDRSQVRAASELLGNMGRAGVPIQKGVAAMANRLARRELAEALGMTPKTRSTEPQRLSAPQPEPEAE